MKVLLVFQGVLICAYAQIPNFGFCPEYPPKSDFNIDMFLGKWYESERYFQVSEVAFRCVLTDYTKASNGRIHVSNEMTNRLTGIRRVVDGSLELTGKLGEGKLNIKYATTPLPTENSITVLDTDYDSYAVIWSCSGFGPLHTRSAWVLTRDRLPSTTALQKAYGVLDRFKINRTFFVKTDQDRCIATPAELNEAEVVSVTAE